MLVMEKEPKIRDLSPALAANMVKLSNGRSIGGLRADMAAEGHQIGQGTLDRIMKGDRGVRMESLQKVADYFGVEVDQLMREGDPASPFVEVVRIDVALSAGPGAYQGLQEQLGSLSFRRDFLSTCGVTPESARIVNVRGTSMEPTIPDGSVLLVNSSNREARNGRIFALVKGDEGLVVKRLVQVNGVWYGRSDNPDGNPDFQIDDGIPVTIIGRVVWMGAKL